VRGKKQQKNYPSKEKNMKSSVTEEPLIVPLAFPKMDELLICSEERSETGLHEVCGQRKAQAHRRGQKKKPSRKKHSECNPRFLGEP
jgi:hypothetical protein